MSQVPKGCLIASVGALGLLLDTLFLAGLVDFRTKGEGFICRPTGCTTMSFTLVFIGLFGAVCTLAFLAALLTRTGGK
jgi:hypothetical protein